MKRHLLDASIDTINNAVNANRNINFATKILREKNGYNQ